MSHSPPHCDRAHISGSQYQWRPPCGRVRVFVCGVVNPEAQRLLLIYFGFVVGVLCVCLCSSVYGVDVDLFIFSGVTHRTLLRGWSFDLKTSEKRLEEKLLVFRRGHCTVPKSGFANSCSEGCGNRPLYCRRVHTRINYADGRVCNLGQS